MALRAVTDHPKFWRLKDVLGTNKATTIGYLECLWHFTGRFAPRGDVGRYDDADIERWAEWDGEPGALIVAFIESGWLDRDRKHRLLVHDWREHADQATKKALKRSRLEFAEPTVTTRKRRKPPDESVRTASGHVPPLSGPPGAWPGPGSGPGPEPEPGAGPEPENLESTHVAKNAPAPDDATGHGNGLPPEKTPPNGDRHLPPADPALVLTIWRKARYQEPKRSIEFMTALGEHCARHPDLGEWQYLIADRLRTQTNPKTGGAVEIEWLVAAEIRNAERRAEYAEQRWLKCFARRYGEPGDPPPKPREVRP